MLVNTRSKVIGGCIIVLLLLCVAVVGVDLYSGRLVKEMKAYIVANRDCLVFKHEFEERACGLERLSLFSRRRLVQLMDTDDDHLYIHIVYLVYRTCGRGSVEPRDIYKRFPMDLPAVDLVVPMNVLRHVSEHEPAVLKQGIVDCEMMALRIASLIEEKSICLVPELLMAMRNEEEKVAVLAAEAIIASGTHSPEVGESVRRIMQDFDDERVKYAKKILKHCEIKKH